jgi:hypothetical protein
MSRKCSICKLPEPILAEVNEMLSGGISSLDEIVKHFEPVRFGAKRLSRSALYRHKTSCLARKKAMAELGPQRVSAIPTPETAHMLALTESVQGRLEALLQSAASFLEGAETLADPKAGLAAIAECRRCLEVVGKITGELRQDVACAVQVNAQAKDDPPDFSKLKTEELITLKRLICKARGEVWHG